VAALDVDKLALDAGLIRADSVVDYASWGIT
jgi:hypothetical protein